MEKEYFDIITNQNDYLNKINNLILLYNYSNLVIHSLDNNIEDYNEIKLMTQYDLINMINNLNFLKKFKLFDIIVLNNINKYYETLKDYKIISKQEHEKLQLSYLKEIDFKKIIDKFIIVANETLPIIEKKIELSKMELLKHLIQKITKSSSQLNKLKQIRFDNLAAQIKILNRNLKQQTKKNASLLNILTTNLSNSPRELPLEIAPDDDDLSSLDSQTINSFDSPRKFNDIGPKNLSSLNSLITNSSSPSSLTTNSSNKLSKQSLENASTKDLINLSVPRIQSEEQTEQSLENASTKDLINLSVPRIQSEEQTEQSLENASMKNLLNLSVPRIQSEEQTEQPLLKPSIYPKEITPQNPLEKQTEQSLENASTKDLLNLSVPRIQSEEQTEQPSQYSTDLSSLSVSKMKNKYLKYKNKYLKLKFIK